jgi:hypothetical protein
MSRKIKDIKDKHTGELVYPRTHISAVAVSSDSTLEDIVEIKPDRLVSGTNIKTINGTSILGSGDITISGGSSDANVQAVDTGDVLDDVTVNYATKTYVDGLVGDINSILESIING